MENNQDDGKPYYVVRFIEVPFEGIDDNVCVPHSWIVIRRATDKKVAVAYPSDEDPFDTRDRAKRKERHNENWKFYMAEIRYETETYREAEYWIASRADWVEKDPRRKAAQSEPTSDSKLLIGSRNRPSKSTRDKPQVTPKNIENLQRFPAKMSMKRAAQSEVAEQLDEERRRQNNGAQASISAGNYINMRPGCSKGERSTVIGEHDHTEAAAASASDKPTPSQLTSVKRRRSSLVRKAEKKLPSLPIIDFDGPIEVISIDNDGHLQDERQPSEASSSSQSQRSSNTTTTSTAPPQPPTSVQQPPHSDHQRHSQDRENSHLNFQPIITEVRSISEADNEQTPRTDGIPSNEPYASHHLPKSQKMSARIYSQMNERPSLIPMHESVEMKIRLANSERLMAIAAQNPSTLMDPRRSGGDTPERQEPTVTQNSLQNSPHFRMKIGRSYDMNALDPKEVLEKIDNVASGIQHTPSLPHQRPSFVRINKRRNSPPLEQCKKQPMDVPDALQRPSGSHSIAQRTSLEEVSMHEASTEQRLPNPAANQPKASTSQSYQKNPGNFHQKHRQEVRRAPTEGSNPAQPTHSSIKISIPPCHLISTNVANHIVLSSESPQQKQQPQYHRDTQQPSRPPEPQVGIPTNANNDRRLPILQGVTQISPPHVQLSVPGPMRQSLKNTYTDNLLRLRKLEAKFQGKPIDHDSGSKVPSQIIPAATDEMRSLESPSSLSQQYRRELLRSDNSNVCQPSLPQQLPEVAMQRVLSEGNIVNPSAVPCPPRSADHVRQTDKRMEVDPVFSDQGSSSHPEGVVDHGVIPEQETFINNADCAGTSGLQNSAPANNQPHTRIVLEQQMLDHFSTIFTQMGSNLYYTCEMFKNLRSSILETADTYKKLMEVAESINALGVSESSASSSSTVAPKILPLDEERQGRAAKRANSSNYQHSSRVDNVPPNKKRAVRWKIVLPAEYDPNDTAWTLKCRKMVPELKELLPGRGIYVNCTKLMHAERVSGDCKTLASLVLEEVFSKTALAICSTWHETQSPKDCWIERPLLDPAAWDALFNYVLRYGSLHDWKIDTAEIIKAMDNKIYEIRVKHDVLVEPYST